MQNYSLHEDLGQIDYLFCDKTGTLTKNELVFNKWASGGLINPEKRIARIRKDSMKSHKFKNFLRCIVLCHDILLINLKNKDGLTIEQKSGASQDELCILRMVEEKGLAKLVAREATSMTIEILGDREIHDILKVNEFSSERKMMSVITKNRESGATQVFAKGAPDFLCSNLMKEGIE